MECGDCGEEFETKNSAVKRMDMLNEKYGYGIKLYCNGCNPKHPLNIEWENYNDK